MRTAEYPSQRVENLEPHFNTTPQIQLLAVTEAPLDPNQFGPEEWQDLNSLNAIAGTAARTCYSESLATPIKYLRGTEKYRRGITNTVTDTRESGHLSTRQHNYYLFGLRGVSRLAIWEILHSYPYHDSDQQSQRYATMSAEGLFYPEFKSPEVNQIYEQTIKNLFAGYQELTATLTPTARHYLLERFPGRDNSKWETWLEDESLKKAREIGRYLLPLAMTANMFHSVSALTLVRYHHLSQGYPLSKEAKGLIDAMVNSVLSIDPSFAAELGDNLPTEIYPELNLDFGQPTNLVSDQELANAEFDQQLGLHHSQVTFSSRTPHHTLAEAVRSVLGLPISRLSDTAAVDLVLNPAKNKVLATTSGETTMHQLSQALNQVYLHTPVALSIAADSQLQRHRSLSHTRPLHLGLPNLDRDIVTPALIKLNPLAEQRFKEILAQTISAAAKLKNEYGLSDSDLAYLYPNAIKIRKYISGPLGAFHHFLRVRTCLTAQEEIYDIAVSIAKQIANSGRVIGQHFEQPAPCGIRVRAGVTPLCPEGKRYCGVAVWKQKIAAYPKRTI